MKRIAPRALPADIWIAALIAGALITWASHSLKVTVVVFLVLFVGGIVAGVLMMSAPPVFQHHDAARPVAPPAIERRPVPGVSVQVAVHQAVNVGGGNNSGAMAAELAALRAQVAALQAGGNHLHLHGLTPAEIAAAAERPSVPQPASAEITR